MLGALVALYLAHARARRLGLGAAATAEAFALVSCAALLGGRLAHCLLNAGYYLERPAQLLNLLDGGLSAAGVWPCAVCALYLWARVRHVPFAAVAGTAALPAAYVAVGAWLGALMRGSQYGAPLDAWFAVELKDIYGVVDVRWPTQLLAAAWSAAIGVSVAIVEKQGRESSAMAAALFVLLYGIGLFAFDATRGDPTLYILGLRITQWLYVVMVSFGLFIIVRRLQSALTTPPKLTRI